MKIVQINATCGVGSTGKICVGISQLLEQQGIENHILFSSRTNGYAYGHACANDKYIRIQAIKSRLLGNYGFNSKKETKCIIAKLEEIEPDIVHLHNIHGHDCNLEMLFRYFRDKGTKLIWTFHDCWAFTGYCTYYTMAKCNKWQSGCEQCPQRQKYSFLLDRSKELYQKKRELFLDLDMTIVTPSKWLANQVKQSFFKDYPVKVIHNGIDLEVFKPTASAFRMIHEIPNDKNILLGVGFGWEERKGLDVFLQLAKLLDDTKYQIVLVGVDDKLKKQLPNNIISINRTQNQKELVEIYTTADLFINPTKEDNYPTVNMESLACGTPVVTFNTGGSPEMLDEACGGVVQQNDVDALMHEIARICEKKLYMQETCLERAKTFDSFKRYQEYVDLYKGMV